MAFLEGKWKRTVFCQNGRLYVLKLCTKNESHSMFSFTKNCDVCNDLYEDSEVGVTYLAAIFKKTKQAMMLIFAVQPHDI